MMDIKQFDIHLSHACNFTCDSCSHYSNYHFSGTLPVTTAEQWYQSWSLRIRPTRINVLGGEPAINPKMTEHMVLARQYWPTARLYLYTNGFLLHKHRQLPKAMQQIGNSVIKLSKHYDSPEYEKKFVEIVDMLNAWRAEYGIEYEISDSFSKWTRRYIDEGGQLHPFQDNDPRKSWEICNARWCLQLHEGKIWKCPIMAYLPMVKAKMGLSKEWDFYLTYKPLEADAPEAEMREFLLRHDEPYCSACPAYKRHFKKNDPTQLRVPKAAVAVA